MDFQNQDKKGTTEALGFLTGEDNPGKEPPVQKQWIKKVSEKSLSLL